ncbi:MAG: HAD-IIIA family hydrolase [Candidatus Omnitrophica bacterium]|nr:HAD-IIIA family hydrolase [Candidatus Omnitrophota bacterium]
MGIAERARKIKLLLLDVDGVLTDGRIIIGSYGDEIKNFDVADGLGIILMQRAGIKCAIITAKNSKIVKIRAKHLGISKIYENHYKIKSLKDIVRRFKVKEDEICFVGDDLIDIPILKRTGLAVAVPNAVKEVKDIAHYVTENKGGRGAVREVCEIILKYQGKWEEITKRYFE